MDDKKIVYSSFYNLMVIAKFDYDKYYSNLLKNALKYGMSREEFWYGEDYKEYFIYQEAYYEGLHEKAHIQGQYFYIGISSILSNFEKDKSKHIGYPEVNLYQKAQEEREQKEKYEKLKLTKKQQQELIRFNKIKQYI